MQLGTRKSGVSKGGVYHYDFKKLMDNLRFKVRELRKKKGFTQLQMSAFRISERQYQRFEKGEGVDISLSTLYKITKALCVDIHELLNFNEDCNMEKDNEVSTNNIFAEHALGKYVVVRSINEGVNTGKVVAVDSTGVVITDARRLWEHKPVDGSWYEGVANSGLDETSQISEAVPKKIIAEDYSLTICSAKAEKSIREFPAHVAK